MGCRIPFLVFLPVPVDSERYYPQLAILALKQRLISA